MMKQRQLGLGRQRPGYRTLTCMPRHALAALSAMGLAALLSAGAQAQPPHVRTRPVAETAHSRPSLNAARSLVKSNTVKKSAAEKSGRVVVVSAHAKTAGRGRSSPVRGELLSSKRRPKAEPVRSQLVKLEPSRRFTPRVREVATVRSESSPGTLADTTKNLTVDDFTRAASGTEIASAEVDAAPVSAIYARGESHPEDERDSEPAVPAPGPKRSVSTKLAVAKSRAPAYALPADLPKMSAGTLLSDGTMSVAQENDSEPIKDVLRAPTREEMTEAVEQPLVLPGLYRNGRLVVPAPLKGTHEILVHQNTVADDEGLERIQDDDDLRRLRAAHLLVNFTETASLHINPELSAERRCARVWTVNFAGDISRAFYARFHEPLQVNSAVRTVAYQVRLQRINGNAAGTDGEAASPHLTGQAMDLGKRGMSMAQIAWMRAYLLPLMQAGKVDVEEEFQQACFHISVYRTYLPATPVKRRAQPRTEVAQLHVPRVAKAAPRVSDDAR